MSEQLFVSSFRGNFFVSIHSYTSDDVNSTVGSIDNIKDTCASYEQAVLLKTSILLAFQGENSNAFIQSVLHHHSNTALGTDISQSYFMVFENLLPTCIFVNATTGVIESFVCADDTTIAGLICVREDGEISDIDVDLLSCNYQPSFTSLCFKVTPTLVGVSAIREINCIGMNLWGADIEATRDTVDASKNVPGVYCPKLRLYSEIMKIRCWTSQHKNATVSPRIKAFYNVSMFQGNISLIAPIPEPNSDIYYMSWSQYYDPFQSFAIKIESYGYPLRNLKMFYNQVFDSPVQTNWFTGQTWEVLCLADGNPTIKVSAEQEFTPFKDENTGNYMFQVLAGEVELKVNVQLVHPSNIECDRICVQDARIGFPVAIRCVINHHYIWNPSKNFNNVKKLPLNITLQKRDHPEYANPCEFSIGIKQPVIYDYTSDYVKFGGTFKSVTVLIEIFSFQVWNTGEYFLEVKPNDQDCLHQKGGSNFCSEAVSDGCTDASTDKRLIRLFFASPDNFGSFAPNPFSSCLNNTRALMIPGFDYPDGNQFFYRICFDTENVFEPGDICRAEGGFWEDGNSPFLSQLIDDLEIPISDNNYDYEKIFRALSCNSYFLRGDSFGYKISDPLTLFVKYRTAGGLTKLLKYKNGKTFSHELHTNAYPPGILCRYPRSLAHTMYLDPGSTSCMYKPIDLNAGREQKINVAIHGNIPAKIMCEAMPNGTYMDLNFTVANDSPSFTYSTPFPEEGDVKSFRCAQIDFKGFHPFHGTLSSGSNETLQWFDFHFSNQPLPLDMDPSVITHNLWCYPGDGTLHQPCYGQTVTLTCCGVGNPFTECRWHRHLGFKDIQPILNGQNGFSWNLVGTEIPQCNNTQHCSNLTIQNLQRSDDGYYWCECFNGLENHNMPETMKRRETWSLQIKPSQSGLVGDPDFVYTLSCDLNLAVMIAKTAVKGAPVTAKVECSKDPDDVTEMALQTERQNGVDLIKFEIQNPTKYMQCNFWASNEYSNDPITFTSYLKDKKIYGDVAINQDEENDAKICCKFCALNVDERNVKVKCIDKDRLSLEAIETFLYDASELNGSFCVEFTHKIFATFECSCELWGESLASITVFPTGDIETEVFTTEAFKLATAAPKVDNENMQAEIDSETETTLAATTEESGNAQIGTINEEKVKYVASVKYIILQLQEFRDYGRVPKEILLGNFIYIIDKGKSITLDKYEWHSVLLAVFEEVAAIEKLVTVKYFLFLLKILRYLFNDYQKAEQSSKSLILRT